MNVNLRTLIRCLFAISDFIKLPGKFQGSVYVLEIVEGACGSEFFREKRNTHTS